ncbi:Major facilitator family transporter [uncultured delta proteobacterium]|uniref:Major facilitator family transporter n=1 Tax=uncultured delta proteobacterium TaxID=34034 RepID=A0A212KFF9_9DELT|nr:Major facilitator family transporter [uncultured delta proteobacterium]
MTTEQLKARVANKTFLRVLVPIFIASMLAFIDRVNISFAMLKMNADLSFAPEIYGMGAGIFFMGYVLFEVPGAILAERWSPSKWIARIMFTWGLVSAMMAFMTTSWHFYILRFLLGACEASLYPVIYACVVPRWFTAETKGKAISLILTSLPLSAMIGGPLAGFLIEHEFFALKGWQFLFLVEGGLTAVYGFAILLFLKDTPESVHWLTDEEKNYLIASIKAETSNKVKEKHYSLLQGLTDPKVLFLGFIYFCWVVGFWGFNFWLPKSIERVTGAGAGTIGLLSLIPVTVALLALIYVGHSSAKHGETKKHVGIPLMIGAAGFLIAALVEGPVASIAAFTLISIGVYSPMGVWWSIPTSFLTGVAAAGATGLINSMGNIGGFVGPNIVGYFKRLTGIQSDTAVFFIFAFTLFLSSILVLTLKIREPAGGTKAPLRGKGGQTVALDPAD